MTAYLSGGKKRKKNLPHIAGDLYDGEKWRASCCAEVISGIVTGAADAEIIALWQRFRAAPGFAATWTD